MVMARMQMHRVLPAQSCKVRHTVSIDHSFVSAGLISSNGVAYAFARASASDRHAITHVITSDVVREVKLAGASFLQKKPIIMLVGA